MSETCPLCGAPKERDVLVGLQGRAFGPKYECGSIYWPSKDKITVETWACRQIAALQAEVARLKERAALRPW